MFGQTNTLNLHLNYTKNEWVNSHYYKKVLDFLIDKKITNFIDIGACSGGVSDVFFNNIPSLKKCIMVEPIKENYDFIVNMFNNNDNRLTINRALYYNKEIINIGKVGTNVGGYSFQSDKDVSEFITTTLEEIYEDNKDFLGSKIDFVKIDIEGAEYNFIENSEILKTIPYIEIEFHNNSEYGIIEGETRHKNWGPFCEKYLPNHKLIYGGIDEKVIWSNGEEVIYDGSGFFILKEKEDE